MDDEWVAALDLLLDHLTRLPGGSARVAARLRDAVLTGAADAALAGLGASPAVKESLIQGLDDPEPLLAARAVLVRSDAPARPDVALRWLLVRAEALGVAHQTNGSVALPGGAAWPYLLLARTRFEGFWIAQGGTGTLSLARLEDLETAAGWQPGTVLLAALTAREPGWLEKALVTEMVASRELAAVLDRHADALRAAFPAPIVAAGEPLARALDTALTAASAGGWAGHVAALLTSSAKRTRTAAAPLARFVETVPAVREAVAAVSRDGSPAERGLALTALHAAATALGNAAFVDEVRAQAGSDRAASVRRLVESW